MMVSANGRPRPNLADRRRSGRIGTGECLGERQQIGQHVDGQPRIAGQALGKGFDGKIADIRIAL